MMFVPRINDITTSFDPIPQFIELPRLHPTRDYSYPMQFRAQQEKGYPSVQPLILTQSPDAIYQEIESLIERETDWEIIHRDPTNKRVEATAITPLLRFRDDIVIEVAEAPNQSEPRTIIQMRSKSRLGKSDLGANAKRILEFWELLKAQ